MVNAKGINLIGSDRSKRVLKLHRTYNVLQGMIRKLLCWSRQLRQYRWKDIFFVHELSLSCFRSHTLRPFFLANCDFLKWWTMWTLQRWWNSCHATSSKFDVVGPVTNWSCLIADLSSSQCTWPLTEIIWIMVTLLSNLLYSNAKKLKSSCDFRFVYS